MGEVEKGARENRKEGEIEKTRRKAVRRRKVIVRKRVSERKEERERMKKSERIGE